MTVKRQKVTYISTTVVLAQVKFRLFGTVELKK